MPLKLLINQIKKDAEERKASLQKEHESEIKEIDLKFKKGAEELKQSFELEFEKEKEQTVSSYKENKEFELKMELLSLKDELITKAVAKAKKLLLEMPFEEKKDFYRKKIKEIENISFKRVIAPRGKKEQFKELFPKAEITEGVFEEGFVIEGEGFSFEVSLPSIVDEVVSNYKSYFLSLLL